MAFPKKVAIVGIGLIGGSIGLAIRKRFPNVEVIGIPRRAQTIELAKKRKAIDRGTLDISAVQEADLIILATPIDKMIATFRSMVPYMKKGTIVTDVASTKSVLVDELEALCPPGVQFVGGHPMAGTEHTGVEYADAAMLKNATFVITMTKNTPSFAVKQLEKFVKALGMQPLVVKPAVHDLVVAAVSHLPYIMAMTLVGTAAGMKGYQELIERIASSGFRDTTRVASSAPSWGRDIVDTNREQIIEVLDLFKKQLDTLRELIDTRDVKALERTFTILKKYRDTLYDIKN